MMTTEAAERFTQAVWSDLKSSRDWFKPHTDGLAFAFSGRTLIVGHLPNDEEDDWPWKCWVEDFDSPFLGSGRSEEEAVTNMVLFRTGSRCPHGYVTGQDSCPGCDAYAEEFSSRSS